MGTMGVEEEEKDRIGIDSDGSPATTTGDDSIKASSDETETAIEPTPTSVNNEIPNGGLTAWLQVVGSFFLFLNCW